VIHGNRAESVGMTWHPDKGRADREDGVKTEKADGRRQSDER